MTTAIDPGLAAGKIEAYRDLFQFGNRVILRNLEATPDDKLGWKPSGTAKSALQIAAHVAATNEFFIQSLNGKPPVEGFPGIFEWLEQRSKAWTTREQVTQALKGSFEELDGVIGSLRPEVLESESATLALRVSAFHATMHSSQIEYLQTCWGDMEFHFLDR